MIHRRSWVYDLIRKLRKELWFVLERRLSSDSLFKRHMPRREMQCDGLKARQPSKPCSTIHYIVFEQKKKKRKMSLNFRFSPQISCSWSTCKIFTFSLRKPVSFDRGLASNLSEVYVWSFERECMKIRCFRLTASWFAWDNCALERKIRTQHKNFLFQMISPLSVRWNWLSCFVLFAVTLSARLLLNQ